MARRPKFKITEQEKEELRRLTQLANRRILNAHRAYQREGKDIVPIEIVGKKELQIKDNWHTPKQPLSRGHTQFKDRREFRRHMQFLREFETRRPGIKEFTEIEREKVGQAIKTALGDEVNLDFIRDKLKRMTAPQLSEFWNRFSDKARRRGLNYSSDAVMVETFAELFPEDLHSMIA